MRKNPSESSRGKRPDDSFSGGAPRGGGKPFKKKNYDGRSSSGDGPSRPARPYSGRTADGARSDKPFSKEPRKGASKEFDKPRKPFGDKPFSDRPKREFGNAEGGDRKPRKDFDRKPFGDKPYSDRPKREFGNAEGGERKPRKDFDRKPFGDKPYSDRPKREFGNAEGGERKPRKDFDRKPFGDKPYSDRPKREFDNKESGERKPRKDFDRKPYADRVGKDGDAEGGERKPRRDFDKSGKGPRDGKSFSDRPKKDFGKSSFKKDGDARPGKTGDSRPFRDRPKTAPKFERIPDNITFSKDIDDESNEKYDMVSPEIKYDKPKRAPRKDAPPAEKKPRTASGKKKHYHNHDDDDDDYDEEDREINQTNGPRLEMPLNKYIAHSGECSRRDAAELVRAGKVKVNAELVLDPGYRVQSDDKVTLSGKKLTPQKGMVYILLNKPKGFITTNEDPQGRKTVMELVASSGVERLFPVGRLDRDTSGLLLMTNDGDLTQKLCHPSFNIKKVYQVTLDKPLTKADFEKIVAGVELEDGKAIVDEIAYLEKKNEIGLEIHSGRNRIVRRIFESLGYVVDKLDRVMYAGLTKKNLPRSKWRYLDEREIVLLKHFKQ